MMIDRDIAQARALVIDGNATSRSVLSGQLRDLGVGHIHQSSRLNDARLRLEQKPFDIVLCEYHFEGTDQSGQDLVDELRRESLLPYSTVFIMVTTEATYAKVMEAAESALDGYLVKPYSATSLSERLTEARRRKRVLKDIFDALERQDQGTALRLCVQRFSQRETYWQFSARLAAELMIRVGRPADARKIYDAVVREAPAPWASMGQAWSKFLTGEVTPARRDLEALVSANPQLADAADMLGRIQIDQGDLGSALHTYAQASSLTPGCLLRLQHSGTLAFYQGAWPEAAQRLSRALAMGHRSKLFDPLTLLLLAVLHFDRSDSKSLNAVAESLRKQLARTPEGSEVELTRMRRFNDATGALISLMARNLTISVESVRQMAEEAAHNSFDVEAACILLMIVSRLPDAAMSLEERVGIAGLMGRRHCVSRATTELLAAAARRDGQLVDQIRSCHAEVSGTAEQAMTHSLRGQPTLAVKNLLEQGQRTCNAKLIDMAALVARRHADAIEGYSVLLAAADDLQQRFGQPVTHLAGVRRVGRAPGGMALRA